MHDCPYERYIPIYLIVGGCFGIVKNLSNIVQRARNKRENREDDNARTNPFDGTLNCFLFAWFIAGLVMLRFAAVWMMSFVSCFKILCAAVITCVCSVADRRFLCLCHQTVSLMSLCLSSAFVCLFIRTDLVIMISHERLEQSR